MTSNNQYSGIVRLLKDRSEAIEELLLFFDHFSRDLEACLATLEKPCLVNCWCTDKTNRKHWPEYMHLWVFEGETRRLRLLASVFPKQHDRALLEASGEVTAAYLEYLDGHEAMFSHELDVGPVTHDMLMYLAERNFRALQLWIPFILKLPVGPNNAAIGDGMQERFLQQQIMRQ